LPGFGAASADEDRESLATPGFDAAKFVQSKRSSRKGLSPDFDAASVDEAQESLVSSGFDVFGEQQAVPPPNAAPFAAARAGQAEGMVSPSSAEYEDDFSFDGDIGVAIGSSPRVEPSSELADREEESGLGKHASAEDGDEEEEEEYLEDYGDDFDASEEEDGNNNESGSDSGRESTAVSEATSEAEELEEADLSEMPSHWSDDGNSCGQLDEENKDEVAEGHNNANPGPKIGLTSGSAVVSESFREHVDSSFLDRFDYVVDS